MRSYVLCFYPGDRHTRTQVEMIDKKLKRIFLRKTPTDLKLDDLFIGAQVNVCARQLKIQDFADDFTKMALAEKLERTLLMVKPDATDKLGAILEAVVSSNELSLAEWR